MAPHSLGWGQGLKPQLRVSFWTADLVISLDLSTAQLTLNHEFKGHLLLDGNNREVTGHFYPLPIKKSFLKV